MSKKKPWKNVTYDFLNRKHAQYRGTIMKFVLTGGPVIEGKVQWIKHWEGSRYEVKMEGFDLSFNFKALEVGPDGQAFFCKNGPKRQPPPPAHLLQMAQRLHGMGYSRAISGGWELLSEHEQDRLLKVAKEMADICHASRCDRCQHTTTPVEAEARAGAIRNPVPDVGVPTMRCR